MSERTAVLLWFLAFSTTLLIDVKLTVIFLMGTFFWVLYQDLNK